VASGGSVDGWWLRVVSGMTLRVVEGLLAEMREQPGGRARSVAMRSAKS